MTAGFLDSATKSSPAAQWIELRRSEPTCCTLLHIYMELQKASLHGTARTYILAAMLGKCLRKVETKSNMEVELNPLKLFTVTTSPSITSK